MAGASGVAVLCATTPSYAPIPPLYGVFGKSGIRSTLSAKTLVDSENTIHNIVTIPSNRFMFVSPPIEKRTTDWRCVLCFYLSVRTVPSWSLHIPKATPSVNMYGNTSSIKLFVSSNPAFAQINPRREASATHVFQLRNRFWMFLLSCFRVPFLIQTPVGSQSFRLQCFSLTTCIT